jgi:hypothetical protein
MAITKANAARIDRLMEQWSPQLQRAFIESVYNMRDAAQLDLIIKWLNEGNIESAMRAVGLDPVQWLPWDKAIRNTFEAAGNATAAIVPVLQQADGMRVVFQFNVRNPAAEMWLSTRAGTEIVEILTDQRNMIREFLSRGMARGDNPRTVALDLVGRVDLRTGRREGGMIGLTSSQEQWVAAYEDALRSDNPLDALTRELRDRRFDGTVRNAAESGEALTDGQINSMVQNYTNRALRYRAETIARTEALTSLHEAQQQAMDQAIAAGLDSNTVRNVWRTAEDDRVRDSHAAMDGQVRDYGEPFLSGAGYFLFYPGDPDAPPEETINCRCWLEPDIDFLAGVE